MLRTLCLIISLLLGPALAGWAQSFRAKRPLGKLSPGWYRLELPAHLQAKLRPGAADLRIWAPGPADTLEAPYLLQRQEPQIRASTVAFSLLNASRQENTYYYTYRLPGGTPINQLALSTRHQNFDWQARVEGSLDGQQ